MFVLDCSIAAAWCFADETTPAIQAIRWRVENEGVVVPALWHFEIANILLQAEKRKRLTPVEADGHLKMATIYPVETEERLEADKMKAIMSLARRHLLTFYDAAYLELAIRREIPLASKDGDLRAAA